MKAKSKYREYSKIITASVLIGAAAVMVYSMVMIAIMQDGEALLALIGFSTAVGLFTIKYYMRRAAQKDNLEQCRRYGTEVFENSKVSEEE